MLFKQWVVGAWSIFDRICIFLQPLGDLFIRCWVAKAFIASGLTKTSSWSSTLLLFQYEYQVPLLPPEMAAVLAVIIELGISAFLVLGLGGRIPALVLFVFNIMAVVSYPVLWTPAGYTGLKDHICWGIVLLVILLHGTGKISLDQAVIWWWKRRHPV